ncbi:MAG: dihydroorotate dehydrogenase electron transfer subunit, partial [Clostridia bacterium]|nr:dihydroorotate dehydrogenase electron transfer subunit [Clostridia bacterium]
MKDVLFRLEKNILIAKNTYLWELSGDTEGIRCGQFVNIKLDGFYLRRPISVCDVSGDRLTLIFKVVGHGTEKMAEASVGEEFSLLTELGNGYDTTLSGDKPLLIGGGAGVPPMYMLCRELIGEGKHPTVILGFNTA